MIIEINTKLLEEHDITPDEYVYLWSLFNKQYSLPFPMNEDISSLEKKGLIQAVKLAEHEKGDSVRLGLTDKGKELFLEPDWLDKFKEFYEAFPQQTDDGRILKSVGLETKVARDAKHKYKKLHKQHEIIMKGLKLEIETRGTKFMHNILTWLNQKEWEKYARTEETSATFLSTEANKLHKDV